MFLDLLVDQYLASVISAATLCSVCYFAGLAGMPGEVAKYGVKPGQATGNYQKHLDSVMGFDFLKKHCYIVVAPGYPRGLATRHKMDIPTRPAHELLAEEIAGDSSILFRAREQVEKKELPNCYYNHPVVQSSEIVVPIGIYMDGVPYSQHDSAVGMWIVNLTTNARHVCAIIRKSIVCQCGCRGRDTFHQVMLFLRWCLCSLACGIYPDLRHDGKPFGPSDIHRAECAGKPLGFKAAVLWIKGDWAEFCDRFGFPSHGSRMRPCFCCNVLGGLIMFDPTGISLLDVPWRPSTDEDYENAAVRCEIRVLLARHDWDIIRIILAYDKRKDGSHGLALTRNYMPLSLVAADRVEPTETMGDAAEIFDEPEHWPLPVTFWRPSRSSIVLFRNPLWAPEIGVTPQKTIALDLLHTFYFGPMHIWSRETLWELFTNRIWCDASVTETEAILLQLMSFKRELFAWYDEQQRAGHDVTRISNMTNKMIGTSDRRLLKTKAMETFWLGKCLLFMLNKHQARLARAALFIESGGLLFRILENLKSYGMSPSVLEQQLCLDMYKRFVRLTLPLEVATPKFHLMYNVFLRMGEQGNPIRYQTFVDEGLNKTLKSVLRLCNQSAFERMALVKMAETLRRHNVKRRLA